MMSMDPDGYLDLSRRVVPVLYLLPAVSPSEPRIVRRVRLDVFFTTAVRVPKG
jgi:hypothetical protein